MQVKMMDTLNARKLTSRDLNKLAGKHPLLNLLETLAGIVLVSFFPVAIVYCFFGILCNG